METKTSYSETAKKLAKDLKTDLHRITFLKDLAKRHGLDARKLLTEEALRHLMYDWRKLIPEDSVSMSQAEVSIAKGALITHVNDFLEQPEIGQNVKKYLTGMLEITGLNWSKEEGAIAADEMWHDISSRVRSKFEKRPLWLTAKAYREEHAELIGTEWLSYIERKNI